MACTSSSSPGGEGIIARERRKSLAFSTAVLLAQTLKSRLAIGWATASKPLPVRERHDPHIHQNWQVSKKGDPAGPKPERKH